MCALAAWIALSSIWSVSQPGSIREAERMLVYVGLALALAIVLRRGDAPGVAGGVLVGITLVSAIRAGNAALPGSVRHLRRPVAYVPAVGAARLLERPRPACCDGDARRDGVRRAQASRPLRGGCSGVVLPVLGATLYFTFSRGAWAGLAFGFVGMVALDPRRLRAAVVSARRRSSFCRVHCICLASECAHDRGCADATNAVAEGHRFALVVVALRARARACLPWVAGLVARRVTVSRGFVRAVNVGLAALVVAAASVALVVAGGPSRGISELKERFDADAGDRSRSQQRGCSACRAMAAASSIRRRAGKRPRSDRCCRSRCRLVRVPVVRASSDRSS